MRTVFSALCCAMALTGAAARPIFVFNEDDTHFLRKVPREEYVKYIDSLCRGTMTHFFMCPNAMRSNIDTKSIEPIWTALDEPGKDVRWAETAKWLHDNKIDPYAIWTARAREKGVSPWLSMRMNDIHGVDNPKYPSLCRLWQEHPEYKVTPNYKGKNWRDHAFDYTHEPVRARALGYIRELLERYDVDGLECDWLRFPWHFPVGKGRERAHILTEFMREARRIVDAASARRGRRILLGARVASSVEGALSLGTDAVEWAKDGLVDWIVPCNFFSTVDFNLDYRDWERRVHAVNPSVTIVPGLDSGVVKDRLAGRQDLTIAEYRGWCAAQAAQGAPGFYVFNPFHCPPTSEKWNAMLDGKLWPCGRASAGWALAYPVSSRDAAETEVADIQTNYDVGDGRVVHFIAAPPPPEGSADVLLAFSPAVLLPPEKTEKTLQGLRLNGARPLSLRAEPALSWLTKRSATVSSWRVSFPTAAVNGGMNFLLIPRLGPDNIRFRACELVVKRAVAKSSSDELPIVDLTRDASRQTVVAMGTKDVYQGHPTTLLTPDGKTLFCVWTINHGGGCGPAARSDDGGRTWTRIDDLLPAQYKFHRNCPTLQIVPRPDGSGVNFCAFSANCQPGTGGGLGILMSRDNGKSWSVEPPATHLSAGMPPTGLMPLKDGTCALFGQVRNDPRVKTDRATDDQSVWMSVTKDGGSTWGPPRVVATAEKKNLCEPFALRSPDGGEIALLIRENRHTARSMMCFSRDEGKTWTKPVDTCWGLTGDRHEGVQLPDGRWVIAFRDRAIGSSTHGQYVAWVGTYDDLRNGRPGQYRIHLLKSWSGLKDASGKPYGGWVGDTGYSGVELLPNGTILCTTYVKLFPDERKQSVACTRFRIEETDAMAKDML